MLVGCYHDCVNLDGKSHFYNFWLGSWSAKVKKRTQAACIRFYFLTVDMMWLATSSSSPRTLPPYWTVPLNYEPKETFSPLGCFSLSILSQQQKKKLMLSLISLSVKRVLIRPSAKLMCSQILTPAPLGADNFARLSSPRCAKTASLSHTKASHLCLSFSVRFHQDAFPSHCIQWQEVSNNRTYFFFF